MTKPVPTFPGVPQGDEAFTAEAGAVTFTVPSGAEVVMRRANGADLRMAARHVTPGSEDRSAAALAAALIRYNGRQLFPDEFDTLPAPDFMAIQALVVAGGPTWALTPSSTSGPTSAGPQA